MWLEFVNFYAKRLIFLPFYDYWSTPFTPLKNLLSPNLGKSMSETCQDLERQSLNKLVFLTYSPFEIRKVSQFSILIDWWMKPNQDIPCKTKIYENSRCYQKNNNNTDNNNSNNNYQCRPRWDKCNLSLLLRLFVMLDALSYRFHRFSDTREGYYSSSLFFLPCKNKSCLFRCYFWSYDKRNQN